MSWRTILPFVVAIGLGVGAVKLGRDMMMQNRGAGGEQVNKVKVLIAKRDLNKGHRVQASDLLLAEYPADMLPDRAVHTPKDAIGRTLDSRLVKNQPLTEASFTASPIVDQIPTGWQAVTVDVNEVTGVAGWIEPGCRVDATVTLMNDSGPRQVQSTRILENIKVMAVGQRMIAGKANVGEAAATAKSVTLLVRAEDVQTIDLASSKGRIRFSLRGPGDDSRVARGGLTMQDMLRATASTLTAIRNIDMRALAALLVQQQQRAAVAGGEAKPGTEPGAVPAIPKPPTSMRTVQVIRGAGNVQEIQFLDDDRTKLIGSSPGSNDGVVRPGSAGGSPPGNGPRVSVAPQQ